MVRLNKETRALKVFDVRSLSLEIPGKEGCTWDLLLAPDSEKKEMNGARKLYLH